MVQYTHSRRTPRKTISLTNSIHKSARRSVICGMLRVFVPMKNQNRDYVGLVKRGTEAQAKWKSGW